MAALVSTPVVAYSTAAAWIAKPAVGSGDLAWLEVAKADGDVRAVAAFRGDRLLIRAAGKTRTVVHEPCMTMPCNTVQGPIAADGGAFVYAVAFPGTGGYVASVLATGASNVIAEDQTDPHLIVTPHLIAAAGAVVVWVDNNSIFRAARSGGIAMRLVTSAQAGGAITSVAVSAAGVAWSAKTHAGATLLGFRAAGGGITVRASEPQPQIATIASVGLADDGTVVGIRRTVANGLQRATLMEYPLVGDVRTLCISSEFSTNDPFNVTRPSVSGARVAVRMRSGKAGAIDDVRIADLATGTCARVATEARTRGRLTDPSLGAGRLVWAMDELTRSGGLRRSRLFSAALLP